MGDSAREGMQEKMLAGSRSSLGFLEPWLFRDPDWLSHAGKRRPCMGGANPQGWRRGDGLPVWIVAAGRGLPATGGQCKEHKRAGP